MSVECLFSMTLPRGGVAGDGVGHPVLLSGAGQGLTLVHFSAQPEPFLTHKHPLNTP